MLYRYGICLPGKRKVILHTRTLLYGIFKRGVLFQDEISTSKILRPFAHDNRCPSQSSSLNSNSGDICRYCCIYVLFYLNHTTILMELSLSGFAIVKELLTNHWLRLVIVPGHYVMFTKLAYNSGSNPRTLEAVNYVNFNSLCRLKWSPLMR